MDLGLLTFIHLAFIVAAWGDFHIATNRDRRPHWAESKAGLMTATLSMAAGAMSADPRRRPCLPPIASHQDGPFSEGGHDYLQQALSRAALQRAMGRDCKRAARPRFR